MTTSRNTVARSSALLVRQRHERRVRAGRRDVHLVGIAREVRHECDRAAVLEQNPAAVLALRFQHVLKQHAARLGQIPLARAGLGLDELEHEVRGVDLTVRMRVADADGLALVLEDQDVCHLGREPRARASGPARSPAARRRPRRGARPASRRAAGCNRPRARRRSPVRRGKAGTAAPGPSAHRAPRTDGRCRRRRCRCTAGWPCR